MSFCGSKSDARSIINDIELSPTTGASGTSKIRDGVSTPGGAAANTVCATQEQKIGEGGQLYNRPRTATETLRRKYAASGK